MDQLELTPVARVDDPETSWQAARSVGGVTEKRAAVLMLLRDLTKFEGGATDALMLWAYRARNYPPQSDSGLRTRRSELVALGLVQDTGERTRLPSGRQAIVWASVQ